MQFDIPPPFNTLICIVLSFLGSLLVDWAAPWAKLNTSERHGRVTTFYKRYAEYHDLNPYYSTVICPLHGYGN